MLNLDEDNKCEYRNKIDNIQRYTTTRPLKLIKLNEVSINIIEFLVNNHDIINFLVENKYDGFTTSYNNYFRENVKVYYLFINNNINNLKILKLNPK